MTASQKDSEIAVYALRTGEGIVAMRGSRGPLSIIGAEFADEALLEAWKYKHPRLWITDARAKSLGLKAQAVSLEDLSPKAVRVLANPLEAGDVPSVQAVMEDTALLQLAKRAGLLPALVVADTEMQEWLHGEYADLIAQPSIQLDETARASLPIAGAEASSIVSFRERGSDAVHLALLVGDVGEVPLTRVHSSCVTGDLLGSLRCDCGGQLALALDKIKQACGGILLYLNQEGRGIGITNKLRAYQLQERGHDTYEANLMLGFDEDERDFTVAAEMLKKLGKSTIRLLSNNPRKVDKLALAGITVQERLSLVAEGSAHNHAYLSAKAKKAGHLF